MKCEREEALDRIFISRRWQLRCVSACSLKRHRFSTNQPASQPSSVHYVLSRLYGGAISIFLRRYESKMSDVDKWIDIAKECKYLPENDLKVNQCVRDRSFLPRSSIRGRSAFARGHCTICYWGISSVLYSDYQSLRPDNHATILSLSTETL